MSYNGSGTFNINSTGQPVVAGTVITASAFNALTTDLATGLTTAITKDGQTTTTARITFAQGITSSLVTDSSSVSTGSIITDGGVGIAKNLYVGGTLNVTGSTALTNPVINNIKMGYTTTATAAGTTTLTVSSNYRQFFTGSTTQTIVLPVTSTLVTGMAYEIENNSTGTLTVNSSGGNLVGTIPAGVCAHAVCIGTTLTTAADWDWDYISTSAITGTGANVLGTSPTIATPTLSGDTTAGTINGLTVGKGGGAVSTNTALGSGALATNSVGPQVVAVGYQAGNLSTAGYSTFIGYQAGVNQSTGDSNTFVGRGITANAASGATTGTQNTAMGNFALSSVTSGSYCVAIGPNALNANTTALNNTAVGYQAGYSQTTGGANAGLNVYVGEGAGYSSTGSLNTILGRRAGYSATSVDGNTFLGYQAGYYTTGASNTFVGVTSGLSMTSGAKNTIIGGYSGNQGGLDIRTSSNYIVLSDGDGNPRSYSDNVGTWTFGGSANGKLTATNNNTINVSFVGSAYNGMELDDSSSTSGCRFVGFSLNNGVTFIGSIARVGATSAVVYNTTSDERLKTNIVDANPVLDKLMTVKVRQYDWIEGDLHQDYGFIAQELEPVLSGVVTKGRTEEDVWQLDYSRITPHLVKAIQELKTIVEAQATEITELKAKVGI